jgi:hypothetical protein
MLNGTLPLFIFKAKLARSLLTAAVTDIILLDTNVFLI